MLLVCYAISLEKIRETCYNQKLLVENLYMLGLLPIAENLYK